MMTAESEMLAVELLGPIRVLRNGVEVKLGSPRQRAIFGVLAMRANSVVSRGELVDAVWGENIPASVDGGIYSYISSLRSALDPQRPASGGRDRLLVSIGSGYCLRLPPAGIDVRQFEALRERAQQHGAAGDHAQELTSLTAALDLWHGEPLSGLPGPFATAQRKRLSELRISTLERRCGARLGMGGDIEVAAELGDLIDAHPLRESLRHLQMLALYRSGRVADALDAYRAVQRILTEEVGIEPGVELQRLYQQILAQDDTLNLVPRAVASRPPRPRTLLSVVPPKVRSSWSGQAATLIGRDREVDVLRGYLADLANGHGRALWIDGESGIGKSELLAVSLDATQEIRCQQAWAVADELGQRFPFQVILECLGSQSEFPDPRLTEPSHQRLHQGSVSSNWDPTNSTLTAIDGLLAFVGELCAQAPLVMVIDDLQWADESSLLVWHRLITLTRRLPLLLVGASRPAAKRIELAQLRSSLESRGGAVISLGALSTEQSRELVGSLLGAVPGPRLKRLAEHAAGNPLYLREMVDSALLAGTLKITHGAAEVDPASVGQAPVTLIAAVRRRLAPLSAATRELLRVAAVLGGEFEVGDVALVLGRPASSLLEPIEEAVEATVLIDEGSRLAFRHPMLRQALYESISVAMRSALQREAAEALARAGAPIDRIAQLLAAESIPTDSWTIEWIYENHRGLISRAPRVALQLLQHVLDRVQLSKARRDELTAGLGFALFRLGADPCKPARTVLAGAADPQRAAEMRFLLARSLYRSGKVEPAVQMLQEATTDPLVPPVWRARLHSVMAGYLCSGQYELDDAERTANDAIAISTHVGDPIAGATALQTLGQIHAIRRDHHKSLDYVDRAIALIHDAPDAVDLHFNLLDTRMFCLQNLDRLPEATQTLNAATDLASRSQSPSGLQVPAAVHYYWTGEWDLALAELDTVVDDGPALTYGGFRERGAGMSLVHGIAALIAVHRDDDASIAAHLEAADACLTSLDADRAHCDFLLMARSLAAERAGRSSDAVAALGALVSARYTPMMLRHQWLPELMRISLAAGAPESAAATLAVCEAEAAQEVSPARALAAARRCRALLSADPAPMIEVAAHYRQVGRPVELALTLEDAAALLVRLDRRAAFEALDEAFDVYERLGAAWDMKRAAARMDAFGPRRGSSRQRSQAELVPFKPNGQLSPYRVYHTVQTQWTLS
jgi:DNA-binding SARP family transcriptional activator/tetratricopeptide (TPR) repeat protein